MLKVKISKYFNRTVVGYRQGMNVGSRGFFLNGWQDFRFCFASLITQMIWHFAVGTSSASEAHSCQTDWNEVIIDADKAGIPHSASGHHNESSLCSTVI